MKEKKQKSEEKNPKMFFEKSRKSRNVMFLFFTKTTDQKRIKPPRALQPGFEPSAHVFLKYLKTQKCKKKYATKMKTFENNLNFSREKRNSLIFLLTPIF